jgi:glycosyltransferase 2 family protein
MARVKSPNRIRRRDQLQLAAGIAGFLVLLWFIDVRALLTTLHEVESSWFMLGIGASLLTRVIAAERNLAVGRAAGLPLTRVETIEALFLSNFWSLALPVATAGSLATVYRYGTCGARVTDSIGVLTLSRVIELVAFCALALYGLALSNSAAGGASPLAGYALLATMIAAVFALLALRHWYSPQRTPERRRGKIATALREMLAAMRRVPMSKLTLAMSLALLQGLVAASSALFFVKALGFSISMADALWINDGVAYLAVVLPLTAAGLGVREVALLAALAPLGVPQEQAIALGVLMFAATVVTALIGGAMQLRIAVGRAHGTPAALLK